MLEEILDGIRDKIACLYRCSEAIALLDMLASYAKSSLLVYEPLLTCVLGYDGARTALPRSHPRMLTMVSLRRAPEQLESRRTGTRGLPDAT